MTTLLIRTRHDGPLEASPRVAAPLTPAALAPAREPAARPGGPRPTLATLLQSYERTYLCQLAASTRRHHAVVFRKLGRHYGDLPLTAITPAWLRQW